MSLVEYPHSLSYHANTLAILPSFIVLSESKIEEQEFPIISEDTIGSSQYCNIPFSPGLSEAFLKAAFISSTVASFSRFTTRSTIEPSGVGTRSETPSSLPLRSGITRPIALAAPVDVGIMERAAALALLKSLCGRSRLSGHLYKNELLS